MLHDRLQQIKDFHVWTDV